MKPHNVEDALIGSVLLDPRQYSEVSQIVDVGDFASERWQTAWKAIASMLAAGDAVDSVTVAGVSGVEPDALLDACNACVLASHAPDYAREVRLDADRRMVSARSYELSHNAKDADDPIGLAVQMSGELRTREHRIATPLGELLTARYETLQTQRAFITFPGFRTVHLHFGDVLIVGARRGVGKSALAAQAADEWSETYQTRIHSLEMSREDWADRYITRHSGVTVNELDEGLDDDGADLVRRMTEDLHSRKLDIADHVTGPDAMVADLRRFAMDGGRIAIIDYLGLLVDKARGESRYEAVTEASRKLKICARQTNLLVVVLAQLARHSDADGKERQPSMNDLRDSGAIEQDADSVLLMHRFSPDDTGIRTKLNEKYAVEDSWQPPDAELSQFDFAKLRRGKSFKSPMWWSGSGLHFSRIDKRLS